MAHLIELFGKTCGVGCRCCRAATQIKMGEEWFQIEELLKSAEIGRSEVRVVVENEFASV